MLCGSAHAQKSDVEIEGDIDFAKGLAKEWGFVDLAGDVIRKIEDEGVSSRWRERLGVAKCEILEQAAVNERDRVRRNELFEEAVNAYSAFIRDNPNSAATPAAESSFVQLCSAYARSIELSMEDVIGEEAAKLQERRVEVLTQGVAKTGDLIDNLRAEREKTEAQKRELGSLMLTRGRMLLDLGKAQEEGQFSLDQAVQILEEAVFEFGEGTPMALRAYDLLGHVYAAQDMWLEASAYFEAVVEQAIPSDRDAWNEMVREQELGQADKEQRWLFVELSTEGLVDAYTNAGETEAACKYALHLYNTQRVEGFQYSPQLGYPSLLAAGRALLDSGGWIGGNYSAGEAEWYPDQEAATEAGHSRRNRLSCADFALKIAQQVNSENRGNVLQIRAQKLIAEIIDRPGVQVAPEVLYEAAEGAYNDDDLDAAVEGFRRVLAALDGADSSARLEFGPKVFYRMGRSFQKLERPWEAAMAYQEGCTTFQGDPEYDSYNSQSFYRVTQDLKRRAPGDPIVEALYREAENIAAKLAEGDKDEILFQQAERKRRDKEYQAAIDLYRQVSASSATYEKALVAIAECTFRMGDTDGALGLFDQYLGEFVEDPKNDIGASQAKKIRRHEAMAKAEFYRGLIWNARAEAAAEADVSNSGGDPAQWRKVVELLKDYYKTYEEQDVLAPWTMRMVVNAHLALEENDAARQVYDEMLSRWEESKYTGATAVEFYLALRGRRDKAEEAGDTATYERLTREMAELLRKGNAIAGRPQFDNLRAESRHWMELKDWPEAERVLRAIANRFGTDAERSRDMVKFVLPDLGHVLLALHKVVEAHEILKDLFEREGEEERPSKDTVLDYCRSVTGWVEGDNRTFDIVPGAGADDAEFGKVVEVLDQIANSVDAKWSCEWYDLKYRLAFAYWTRATAEWGPQESKYKSTAEGQLGAIVQELGPQFRGKAGVPGVDENCMEAGGETARVHGGDLLRSRMAWLWSKVQ